MPYTQEISRAKPGLFLFLLDQSGSMNAPFGAESGLSKSQGAADALNRLLRNLVLKCTKQEGVRDYFDVGVIGYGSKIDSIIAGMSINQIPIPISKIADNPLRTEERVQKVADGAGGVVEQNIKFPVWVDPIAQGPTPMCQTLSIVYNIINTWVSLHQSSFPPIVINITDGEATDGDPEPEAVRIKNLSTADGNVLLFNCHISSVSANPIIFPENEQELPDRYASSLFRMSSILPPAFKETAISKGYKIGENPYGFAFNADVVTLVEFLDIGTRAASNAMR